MTDAEDGAAGLDEPAPAAVDGALDEAESAEGPAELAERPAEGPADRSEPLPESLRAQVDQLAELDERPVAEHIQRYEAVHDELNAALRGIHNPGG